MTNFKLSNFLVKRDQGELSSWQAKIPTKSGKLILSIVAGTYLYSEPRKFLEDPSEYTQVEIAIFNAETGDWASYNEVKPAFDYILTGEYVSSDEDDDAPQNAVFPYVRVEQIINAINVL